LQIKASVPSNAITGPVTVTVAGVTAQGPNFTVAFGIALTTSANPSTLNVPLTLTATVTPLAATGTVKFKDGSTTLSTKTISNGVASYSISTLVAGSHSITAVYSGNSSYPSSTSPTLTQSVMTVASVAVSPASLSLPLGSVERYIATAIHPDGSMQTIPGGVTWSSSSTSIGTIDTTGLLTAVGQGQTTIQATFNSVAGSTGLTVGASSFRSAGSLNTSRTGHTATLLPNGKVLIAGGENNLSSGNDTTLASCEIYDPVSQTFSLTGSLNSARTGHAAMLLPSGKVLIAGGQLLNPIYGVMVNVLTLELYDPATGTFSQLPGTLAHSPASAALLNNGMVLFFGYDVNSLYPEQLYDPSTGVMSNTGDSVVVQNSNTATLLSDGTVLLAGGYIGYENPVTGVAAELYDPATGMFTPTGNMLTATVLNTSTLLNNGMVLIAGGENSTNYLNGDELYNPTAKTFSATASLALARTGHTATLLNDGTVLVIGGNTQVSPTYITGTAELFDPSNQTFTGDGSLATPRGSHTTTRLNDGTVLIVGGFGSTGLSLATAELYAPPLPVPTSIQITPVITSMVVGQTQQFEVLDQLGHQRFDITWSVSNPNIVWMIPVNPMILTASGEGQVTLTATVAGVSAQLQIAITPSWMQVTPATVNMWVTGTQQFTAVDNLGNPATNVTWTVSDSTLGTITTGNPAVLTATAAGNLTLTATVEGVSAQAQIAISPIGVNLPPGSVLWSVPPVPGYSAMQIAQAVPTSDGPDLYSIQLSVDGTQSVVQALKADGEQMWQSKLPTVTNSSVPDGFGGLIVTEYDTCTPGQTNPMTIAGLNPQTGQPWWQISAAAVQYGQQTTYCYPSGPGGAPQIAVRGDGAVIISEPTNNGLPPVMMVGGPSQGVYSIPTSTSTDAQGVTIDVQCCTGPPMVNSDGTAYLEYEVRNIGFTKMISDTLYLFQINPDNSSKSTVLSSTTQNEALLPGPIIPDGQGGILATWTISPSIGPVPQFPYQAADVVSGQVGTPYNLPFSPKTLESGKSPTLVLGENGTAFGASSSTTTDGTNTAVDQIASFNVTSGTVIWSYQAAAGNELSIIAATAGNGLVAKTTDQNGADTVIRFDATGAVGASRRARTVVIASSVGSRSGQPAAADTWTTAGYKLVNFLAGDTFVASSLTSGQAQVISSGLDISWALYSPWAKPQPDNRTDPKVRVKIRVYQVDDAAPVYPAGQISQEIKSARDYWWTKAEIGLDWDSVVLPLKACNPALHPGGCDEWTDLYEIHGPSQYNEMVNTINAPKIQNGIDPSKGISIIFTGMLFDADSKQVDGITPYNHSVSAYDNFTMIPWTVPWQVVAHELGHGLQLRHFTTTDALVSLDPAEYWFGIDYIIAGILKSKNNLMCGPDPSGTRLYCPNVPNTDLTWDQIKRAQKGAAKRSN
jgi:hypothetical protein